MRRFLPDFINTLSERRQVRVADILNEARVGKSNLAAVAKFVEQNGVSAPISLNRESFLGLTSASRQTTNFRDISLNLRDMFGVANNVSLLVDSHKAILSSEIKELEDELLALEKLARNYAFLLEEGKVYSFAYLEAFNDELGRDTSLTIIPDRAGSYFQSNENAVVRSSEGVLVLPLQSRTHGLIASIVKGNSLAISEQVGSLNNITTNGSTGWQLIAKSPNPISTAISEISDSFEDLYPAENLYPSDDLYPGQTVNPTDSFIGAQVGLEFSVTQPSPASEISITPFADYNMELVQVVVYSDENEDSGERLLTSSRLLDRPMSLHFPVRVVTRFRIYINQPVYVRRSHVTNVAENQYRTIMEEIRVESQDTEQVASRAPGHRWTRRRESFRRLNSIMGIPRFGRVSRRTRNWRDYQDVPNPHIWAVIDNSITKYIPNERPSWVDYIRSPMTTTSIPPAQDTYKPILVEVPPRLSFTPAGFDYEYRIGIHNVSLGLDSPGFKGAFVSKPFNSPGDIGELRLKSEETNYYLPSDVATSRKVTSVEYSVSNRAQPSKETDWIPIQPIGETEVIGERFFPDDTGKGFFRFYASPLASTKLYKDQVELDVLPENFLYSSSNTEIIGLRLEPSLLSSNSIFTVDYVPSRDYTIASFETQGFTDVPLVSAFDQDGTGEGYASSYGLNEITLKHHPYIDADKVEAMAAVADHDGFEDPTGLTIYRPILVRLSDGSFAEDVTDYLDHSQITLPPAEDGVFYISSGNTLKFNQPVENVRVFYQYLENSVRVRVVLRSNHQDFVSPQVDYYHIKSKVRKPDILGNL